MSTLTIACPGALSRFSVSSKVMNATRTIPRTCRRACGCGRGRAADGGYRTPERVVVIEFPDMAAINAWYASPEYQPLIELRKSCQSENDLTFFMDGL